MRETVWQDIVPLVDMQLDAQPEMGVLVALLEIVHIRVYRQHEQLFDGIFVTGPFPIMCSPLTKRKILPNVILRTAYCFLPRSGEEGRKFAVCRSHIHVTRIQWGIITDELSGGTYSGGIHRECLSSMVGLLSKGSLWNIAFWEALSNTDKSMLI